jgi:hypothetical protein
MKINFSYYFPAVDVKNLKLQKRTDRMKKMTVVVTLVATLLGGMLIAFCPAQAKGETEEMYIQHNLRQGPCFKLVVSAKYLIKNGKEIGRDVAAKHARIALEGLKSWGWISQFRGIESSTIRFNIKVDVSAIVSADGETPVTATRVYAYKQGGEMVAFRDVDHFEAFTNRSNYQESLGMAVEQVQLEALTEGKEVWKTDGNSRPGWVEEQMKWFRARYPSASGINDTFGWGRGSFKSDGTSQEFVWFLYSSSDGPLTLALDFKLPSKYIKRIETEGEKGWSAVIPEGQPTLTAIILGSSWIESPGEGHKRDVYFDVVSKMNTKIKFLTLEDYECFHSAPKKP